MGFPGIEAIFDAFGVAVQCAEFFETALQQTLHVALPTIHRMLQNLESTTNGEQVWRGDGKPMA